MKIQFKHQDYQKKAVDAVVDCFEGQPYREGINYRMDLGKPRTQEDLLRTDNAFKNHGVMLSEPHLLNNIHQVQGRNPILGQSQKLVKNAIADINLDIEMETGVGKTYCYIKTMFEMYKRFGWSKFIVVVPSIAIREGVHKSLKMMADHFQIDYQKRAKFFIYDSDDLHQLESFSSDAGINVMIINMHAFNSAPAGSTILNKKNKIYRELDGFQSRRPIDVIKANHPILILDEPQKMEGKKTLDSFKEFNPLMILRYSATYKENSKKNEVYRLDALDAFNDKLVKKIQVRGIAVKGLSGTNAYLYIESIKVSKQSPQARVEMERKTKTGIKREIRMLGKGDDLYIKSEKLDQYKGFVISEINANTGSVSFTNGVELIAGEATGDVNDMLLRRFQIREAIKAHFQKEQDLFKQGIKVLSLFFIDAVAKYRVYNEGVAEGGEYAKMFEEEYMKYLNSEDCKTLCDPEYREYLESIDVAETHNGYFSVDKKGKMVDSKETGRGEEKRCDDVDAYDLILKDKESLLSYHAKSDSLEDQKKRKVRFIFSHSALREGWDNPNVFVICTLKHTSNDMSRRQEVGRGLRLCVNQDGERMDDAATVHKINVLTVVANESYKDFVEGFQKETIKALSERPSKANEEYFTGKTIMVDGESTKVSPKTAKQIYRYLLKNDYIDDEDNLTTAYHEAKREGELVVHEGDLEPISEQVFELIDAVLSKVGLPEIGNGRNIEKNYLNKNYDKKEFKELWNRINHKAVYTVNFDSQELVKNCIKELDSNLLIKKLVYTVRMGEQKKEQKLEDLQEGSAFKLKKTDVEVVEGSVHSGVKYDLVGKIADGAQITRKTAANILSQIDTPTFGQFKDNPESFISEAIRLIKEQKATLIINHLSYDALAEKFDSDIFTKNQTDVDFSKVGEKLERHIYDYVVTDSKIEKKFVSELDTSSDVIVYVKLPNDFHIPTPVGNYNPDWAISFRRDSVKHVYFVAETKGDMSTMSLRPIEDIKIKCASKFFDKINQKIEIDKVKYKCIDDFSELMNVCGLRSVANGSDAAAP